MASDHDPGESDQEAPGLPETHRDVRHNWWAWIVIVLAVGWIVVGVRILPSGAESIASQDDSATLAILRLQSQMAIGMSGLQPGQTKELTDQLRPIALAGDETTAALAIVHRFIGGEGDGLRDARNLIQKRSSINGSDDKFLTATEQALTNGVTDLERTDWLDRLGWFGNLFPNPDGSIPDDSKIRARGLLTAIGGSFLVIGAFGAGIIGLILLVLFFVMRSERKMGTAFDPKFRPARVFLESFALYLGLMAASDVLGILLTSRFPEGSLVPFIVSTALFVAAFVLGLTWPVFRGFRWKRVRHALGIHRGKGIAREIGAGFLGYLAVIPVAGIGVAITYLLIMYGEMAPVLEAAGGNEGDPSAEIQTASTPSHPIVGWMSEGGILIKISLLLLAAVIAPLFEEIMFRGALQRAFRSRWRFFVSALAGGFIFAVIHPQGWVAVPALTMMGVGFAMLREWRDSLIAPMTAHAINNGCLILLLIAAFS
ncbi:MAG: CPBP family intramembrane metalloprotease [Verrucomicrobiales bacterium]|nr:CPBP family intramembrane metalloprotease [Verrucomicrobiales bacterium]